MRKISRRKSFTLVELLVAISIFATIVTVAYTALHIGLKAYSRTQAQLRLYQEINQVFDRMALELRNCYDADYNEARATGGFIGEANELSFFTITSVYSQGKLRNDIARISYQWKDKKAIKRQQSDKEAFLDSTYGKEEELISEVNDMQFAYLYSGQAGQANASYEWRGRWSQKSEIPLGVRVTMTRFDPRYQLTVTLTRSIFLGQGKLDAGNASDLLLSK